MVANTVNTVPVEGNMDSFSTIINDVREIMPVDYALMGTAGGLAGAAAYGIAQWAHLLATGVMAGGGFFGFLFIAGSIAVGALASMAWNLHFYGNESYLSAGLIGAVAPMVSIGLMAIAGSILFGLGMMSFTIEGLYALGFGLFFAMTYGIAKLSL